MHFVKEIESYIGEIEPESKYFLRPFSEPVQYGACYKVEDKILNRQIGLGIVNYNITNIDFSMKGQNRPYSEIEYSNSLKMIEKDSEIEESSRTLEYMSLEEIIIGAIQICKYQFEDTGIELVLSEYFTHGSEYAGNVYVIDLIKDGEVIRTYEKANLDGPY